MANKKVLVLEKHTEPGGLTHVFRHDGAPWDVGLHYIGEVEPGSQARALFDYLSDGNLHWTRMADQFERFIYPGIDVAVSSNPTTFERTLVDLFPEEKRALHRYFADIRRVVKWTRLGFMCGMVPKQVVPILRLIQRLTGKLATRTTGEYLNKHFQSPALRAVLASQWGDYGLPPSRSAFAIHAQIVSHYLNGAWFPKGGSAHIARTFETGIERTGGSIRVAQEVTSILVEGNRTVGVTVVDRRGPNPVERTYLAPVVISNIGAPNTFERLLPTEGKIGIQTEPLRTLIRQLGTGFSAVSLYLRLKADPRTLGVRGENYWVNTGFDHDDIAGHTHDLLEGRPRNIYVSFPSIKAGDDQFHTAEILSFVESDVFSSWRDKPKGNRGADYSALKSCISDGLLKLADATIPGLAALVSYAELATPLTMEHYTSHPSGCFYGLPAIPERYRSGLLGPRTPINGLYLSGSDAACLGILGAMTGGVSAACSVLGPKGYSMIQAALKAGPTQTGTPPLPMEKKRAVLIAKHALTPSIWQVEFQIDSKVEDFAPGQFARLHVGNGEWRDYSIAGLEQQTVRFLISTRTGGYGSRFIEHATAGTQTEIELPLGQYTLSGSDRRQVFVATGSGLSPFLPMFEALQANGLLANSVLFFGCRTASEDLTSAIAPLPSSVIRCVSREPAPYNGFNGRVSGALASFMFDPDTTDFYLCGSSAMVADCRTVLEARGVKHLYIENF